MPFFVKLGWYQHFGDQSGVIDIRHSPTPNCIEGVKCSVTDIWVKWRYRVDRTDFLAGFSRHMIVLAFDICHTDRSRIIEDVRNNASDPLA
jgi:hypothetical protein